MQTAQQAFSSVSWDHDAHPAPEREDVEGVAGAFVIRNAFSSQEATALCATVRLVHEEEAVQQEGGARRASQHHSALPVTALALAPLARRLRSLLPGTAGPGSPAALAPPGLELSTFLRCYKYLPGDESPPHWDKSYTKMCEAPHANVLSNFSAYSLLLYASDDCAGGQTTFFSADPSIPASSTGLTPKCSRSALSVCAAVTPRAGDALVFPHGLHKGCFPSPLHEGSLVTRGEKLLIRTDVVYYCATPKGRKGRAGGGGSGRRGEGGGGGGGEGGGGEGGPA